MTDRSTYVLDTSVLLAEPGSVFRFDEHEVVLPLVVIAELESKRDHPELGWAARRSLRLLEDLQQRNSGRSCGRCRSTTLGGTLRVEINHMDATGLPAALVGENNDHRILAVAKNLSNEAHRVVVVTKDLPLRLKASIVGLEAEEYRNELANDGTWTGFVELDVESEHIDELWSDRVLDLADARDLPCNTGVALTSGSQSALGRIHADKRVHLVRGDRSVFDVRGRSRRATRRDRPPLRSDGRNRAASAATPARARASSRSRPASTRCSSNAHTSGCSCSGHCSPSEGKSSGSCPAPRPRRWHRGPPRSATRSSPSSGPR